MGERFVSMDMAKANEQCARRFGLIRNNCGKCDSPVMLHCDSCNIQVTGCVCTEVDRFGESADRIKEIYDRMAEQVGPDVARERLTKAGFWIPKGTDLN